MGTTLCMCLPQTTTAQTVSSGDSWTWDKGTIVIDTPERPAGQKSVLGLTTPKMEVNHRLYRTSCESAGCGPFGRTVPPPEREVALAKRVLGDMDTGCDRLLSL